MKRALLLLPLLLAGCSSQAPNPSVSAQNPPEPNIGAYETSAQINAEIVRRYPPETNQSNLTQGTQVALDILDNAKSAKTVQAVKDWANDNLVLGGALKPSQTDKDRAYDNTCKWIIAATEAKRSTGLASLPTLEYKNAKKNALSEAARADSLPLT